MAEFDNSLHGSNFILQPSRLEVFMNNREIIIAKDLTTNYGSFEAENKIDCEIFSESVLAGPE
jgi:hypothetical protein